jgi:hypothetical protein
MLEIERPAIEYFGEALDDPGVEGLAAGLELFEFAIDSPADRKSELRRSLRCLTSHRARRPFETLSANTEVLRVAPYQWVRYLRAMLAEKKTRKFVGEDWVVSQIMRPMTKDDAYKNLLVLKSASGLHLGKEQGRQMLGVATAEGGWSAPIRVWAAHQWGQSDAFRPESAVEQVECQGDFSSRRAFALTLAQRRSDKRLSKWLRRVQLADRELQPTIRWIEAA